MPILLIETSTERGCVAILEDNTILFHAKLPFGYNNSQSLLPEIQRGLIETGVNLHSLDYLAVGVGPGSYTGIRVGAVAAKTLAYACGIPLIGFCSLQGFFPGQDGIFGAIIDARIGGAYLLLGECRKGVVSYRSNPELCELKNLPDRLEGVGLLMTPQKTVLQARLQNLGYDAYQNLEERDPDPLYIKQQVQKKFERGEYSKGHDLELMYMRKTQAEIELLQKKSI